MFTIAKNDRLFPFAIDPAVTPLGQRDQHRHQFLALGGELVLVALGAFLDRDALENAVGDEFLEASGEDVAGDTQMALKVLEAADAEKGLADDQHRPAFAQTFEYMCNGAIEWIESFFHARFTPW